MATADTGQGRSPLTRDRILTAAVGFADANGIQALSMRKLANDLGFEVMSLYNHVANKADILSGVVDLVVAEAEMPPEGLEWRAAIHQLIGELHHALVRHPWTTRLWYTTSAGPARLQFAETLLSIFRGAGFSAELTHHGFHAVNRHLLGFTAEELDVRVVDEDLKGAVAGFLEQISEGQYPHLIEHANHHIAHPTDDSDFVFGLNLILDGLERARGN